MISACWARAMYPMIFFGGHFYEGFFVFPLFYEGTKSACFLADGSEKPMGLVENRDFPR